MSTGRIPTAFAEALPQDAQRRQSRRNSDDQRQFWLPRTVRSQGLENAIRIQGTEGALHIPWPWIPNREGVNSSIFHISGKQGELIEETVIETKEWLYGAEADIVARDLKHREAGSTAMSHADTNGTYISGPAYFFASCYIVGIRPKVGGIW